jgi:2,3-dihydro-2,3-dihydroxybenzoate dehydrogenase
MRTAVVIGVGQGLGPAVAGRLAADPWTERLVLSGLTEEDCATAADAVARDGLRLDVIPADLTDLNAVGDLVQETGDAARVALLAGIYPPAAALDVTPEQFRDVFAVNVFGTFFAAQGYARHMVARGSGAIVAVASTLARMPRMQQAAYASSKAALRQALRVLGLEVAASGVRVNMVSPGVIDTPMLRARYPHGVEPVVRGDLDRMKMRIPSGRLTAADDVAAAVSFFLGDDSGHVLLQDLVVDGGETLGM